uniref:Mago-bind domain-containing protein n=2 Tax=Strongyloides stercoralis TaxID=6248 RepID=A0A0K0EFY8_STRER
MKDREKKLSDGKYNRHSKREVDKNKKIDKKQLQNGEKLIKKHKKEKINDDGGKFHGSMQKIDNLNMSLSQNLNINQGLPIKMPTDNNRSNITNNLTKNMNNQVIMKRKSEREYQDKHTRSPNLPSNRQTLNIKNDSLEKKEIQSSDDNDNKEIKIKRTPRDYGIGEYSSIKIQTKCVNGRLFHDVNIQTFDQRKKQFKSSQNLDVPIYGRSTYNPITRNNVNQNYSQLLKAKVSKNLQLNKKDIVLAKIHHLKRAVDKINNHCIH